MNNRCFLLTIIVIIFCSCSTFSALPLNLTEQQKQQDFDYLFKTLLGNYPYFWINERQNAVNWLANRLYYRAEVSAAADDYAFYKAIQSVLGELHNGHTGVIQPQFVLYMRSVYERYPERKSWFDVLNTARLSGKLSYWIEVLAAQNDDGGLPTTKKASLLPEAKNKSLNLKILPGGETAYMKIQSFAPNFVEADGKIIAEFYKTIYECNSLIIDIQDNDGGATGYWIDNIVKPLAKQNIFTKGYAVLRGGDLMRVFPPYPGVVFSSITDLPKLPGNPPELLREFGYYYQTDSGYAGASTARFTGKIYLLVNNVVFSASESLAMFCKETGFATIIGSCTCGDGGGTDPALFTLPNSGLVIRFAKEMVLNPDGSANEETHTAPDYVVDADNDSDAAFKKALELIAAN